MTAAAPTPLAIEARDLWKTYHIYEEPRDRLKQLLFGRNRTFYKEFTALRDISFQVGRGETVGLVGRNGSGKSTLLQLIVGTLTPSQGRVTVNGRVAALLELGAGFNPEFSGRDNVYMNAGILGLTREETESRFQEILDFADIGAFIDRPVKTYSSGMYVRLAFAVAINVHPDILVVDEALAVGDEAFQRKCYARIHRFKENGGTLLFVSHSAAAVVELCDRAICLDQGEMLLSGSPKQVVALYHKLIYALPERVAAIKDAMRRDQGESLLALEASTVAESGPTEEAAAAEDDELQDFFDPGLKPEGVTTYEHLGAEILDPHLTTPDGRRVNVLVNRREYRYTYTADFSDDGFNVRCGMLIKSVSGVEIGGSVTAPVGRGRDHIPRGTRWRVSFKFRCALAPGVYFLNAGILGMVDGAERYLARTIDVAMFRVQVAEATTATSMVDFLIEPSLEPEPGSDHD